MKKKFFAVLLSLAMTAGALSGCGSNTNQPAAVTDSSAPAEKDTTEKAPEESSGAVDTADISEHVTLKWILCGNDVKDDAAVLEAVNKYLNEKLNMTIEPIWRGWGDFDDNAVLSLQGGEAIDIYFTSSWTGNAYNKFSRDGYWVQLDDPNNNLLEKYAKETWDMLPNVLKETVTVNGSNGEGVYAIPGWKDYATQNCWDINVPLLEKYGYSLDDIRNTDYYGFGEILAKVKKGEGDDFYPLLVEGMVLERMVTNSIMVTGDSTDCAVLSYYLDPTDVSKPGSVGLTIVNKFATEEYKKFVETTYEYYQKGYIDPAMANALQANDARTNIQNEGAYLIGTQVYSNGYEIQASAERGYEVAMIPCTEPYSDTTSAQGALMAVSTASKNPERAVMFLNLLNTDPYLMSLFAYGVEGVHYELNSEGEVAFLPDRDNYKPWVNGLGNVTQLTGMEGQGANFYDEFKAYYAQATAIPILGYAFDPTAVQTELGALANVGSEYALALNTGFVDPAVKLPEFLEKLEQNGMQKVLDEANAQIQEFLE